MKYDTKRMNRIRREVSMEVLATVGPQHGRASSQLSKRDKARCPKLQRKNRSWMRDF